MPGPQLSGRAALCVNRPQGLRSHPSSATPWAWGMFPNPPGAQLPALSTGMMRTRASWLREGEWDTVPERGWYAAGAQCVPGLVCSTHTHYAQSTTATKSFLWGLQSRYLQNGAGETSSQRSQLTPVSEPEAEQEGSRPCRRLEALGGLQVPSHQRGGPSSLPPPPPRAHLFLPSLVCPPSLRTLLCLTAHSGQ